MPAVCRLLQPEGWDPQALWRSRREASELADDGAERRAHRRPERAEDGDHDERHEKEDPGVFDHRLAPLVGPSQEGQRTVPTLEEREHVESIHMSRAACRLRAKAWPMPSRWSRRY